MKDVVLGEGRAKVIVPITGRTAKELQAQASDLGSYDLDVVEWRVDFFDDVLDTDAVLAVAEQIVVALGGRPLVFTFRTVGEGGAKPIEPEAYVALNTALIESGLIDAIDVQHGFDRAGCDTVIASAKAHGVAVVGSFHDFCATPPADVIVSHLVAMQERGCDIAKAAFMPVNPGDVLALLNATWTMTNEHPSTPVLTMSMAGMGLITRMAAQVVGSCATFATVGLPSAPGQVPVEQLQPILDLLDENLAAAGCAVAPADGGSGLR